MVCVRVLMQLQSLAFMLQREIQYGDYAALTTDQTACCLTATGSVVSVQPRVPVIAFAHRIISNIRLRVIATRIALVLMTKASSVIPQQSQLSH